MKQLYTYIMLLLACGLFAQQKAADSLLAKAGEAIYNDPDLSVTLAQKAYRMSGGDYKIQVASLITISNAYFAQRKTTEAQHEADRALALAKKNNDYVGQMKVYGLVGNHYQILKMNSKAREYLDKAEQLMQKHPIAPEYSYLKGNIYAVKGNSYRGDLDCDFAVRYFDKAITEFSLSSHRSATQNLKLVQMQKGFCLLDLGRAADAEAVFNAALQNTTSQSMFEVWVYANIGMARCYMLKGNAAKAADLLEATLHDSPQGARKEVMVELYKLLTENYFTLGGSTAEKYLYYSKLYRQEQLTKGTQDNRILNEVATGMVDDYHQKENRQSQSQSLRLFVLYGVLAVLVGFLMFFSYKKHKQLQRIKQTLFYKTLQE